jgi:uncharacterized protein with GYD domain
MRVNRHRRPTVVGWRDFAGEADWRLSPAKRNREDRMARYIELLNWTDQGVKNVKDSPKRLDAARQLAKKMGCEVRDFYMTTGACDMVVIIDAPDDEAVAKFNLTLAMGGNVRTTTLKAFPEDAYRKIIGAL